VAIDLLLETGGGGAGRHVLDLHRELCRLGWRSTLLVSRLRADRMFLAELASLPPNQVHELKMARSPRVSDIPIIVQLRNRYANEKGRRILHAHSTKSGMLGWAAGDRVAGKVLTPHAYRGMDRTLSKRSAFIIRKLEATYSKAFGMVIAVSPDEKSYIKSLGISNERVCYIPNGVDKQSIRERMFPPSVDRTARKIPVFGFVGRLVSQKNPGLFLDALKVLSDRGVPFNALIVGSGELQESLARKATQQNINHLITWAGDIVAVEELSKIDLFVHTSRYESLPYTLLEAVAAEIPIVATENSGTRAIFEDLLPSAIVHTSTPYNLADAMLKLLEPGIVRSNHIEALQVIAQRFTIQKMVQSTVEVYEELLSRSGTKSKH
jgi:glycosyltransferase involved in cell wall biosynthesis